MTINKNKYSSSLDGAFSNVPKLNRPGVFKAAIQGNVTVSSN